MKVYLLPGAVGTAPSCWRSGRLDTAPRHRGWVLGAPEWSLEWDPMSWWVPSSSGYSAVQVLCCTYGTGITGRSTSTFPGNFDFETIAMF